VRCVAQRGLAIAVAVLLAMRAVSPVAAAAPPPATLVVYWGVHCPHCEEARPFVDRLEEEVEGLEVEWVEVRRDAAGRQRFIAHMQRLGVQAAGVPTFVVGEDVVVGFRAGATDGRIRALIEAGGATGEAHGARPRAVPLPIVGTVDPGRLSLPVFTVMLGFVDGLNPCALWVLLVMLGVLVHVRSRARLALVGGTFVVMSGVVYYLFMTLWTAVFSLAGASRLLTRILGMGLIVMGAINLKELVWFKRGPSLTIPERAKPGLFRRIRAVADGASGPAAFAGIAALAFVVNLIELGCTIGLPAVYTRLLTLEPGLSVAARHAYLALYNLAYVVPLGLVVLVYALTLHRLTLSTRRAQALKAVSGAVLVLFGLLFVLAPDALG
jgi:hypothetical protein